MEEKDINTYLNAKRQRKYSTLLSTLSGLMLLSLIFLETMQIQHDSTIVLAIFSFIFLIASQGPSSLVTQSRADLLAVIERQISRDPNALQILANRKSPSA